MAAGPRGDSLWVEVPSRWKADEWRPGLWGGRRAGGSLGLGPSARVVRAFWNWVGGMLPQPCECTKCRWVRLKMVRCK